MAEKVENFFRALSTLSEQDSSPGIKARKKLFEIVTQKTVPFLTANDNYLTFKKNT